MDTLTIALIIGIAVLAIVLGAPLAVFVRRSSALNERMRSIEHYADDAAGHSTLGQQIEALAGLVDKISTDTQNWASAFTFKPIVQGKWGEIQVENLLQFAGMKKTVDYDTQVSMGTMIADFVVYLPDHRKFVIDSKVTVESLIDYHNAATHEDRKHQQGRIASRVRSHANKLAKKLMPPGDDSVADFVVMCIPDYPLQLAIEHDHRMIEKFARKQVIICGQSALLALIKSVAMSWRSVKLSKNAENILAIGSGMYERLMAFNGYLNEMNDSLDSAMRSCHRARSEFELNLLSQARQFEEMGM